MPRTSVGVQYTRVIHAYMCFAGFSIFFVLVGIIAIQVLQKEGGHMDWISFVYILFNFAAIGAVTLFFAPAPLLLKQSYLVITGVVTAFVFTWIPEWTTWILLGAMSVYDIVAVLTPAGPLQMLVQMAEEREEEIPALVYQARPVERRNTRRHRIQEISAENGALMGSASDHNEGKYLRRAALHVLVDCFSEFATMFVARCWAVFALYGNTSNS